MAYTTSRQKPKVIPIDKDGYLSKLKLSRELPSVSFLKKLHKAHLLHIPIENLDFHLGKVLPLDVLQIQKKILNKRRGGVSYELNGLFFQLLLNLGFDCHLASSRLAESGGWSAEFDHPVILVRLDSGIWLVDVSGADTFIEPKELVQHKVQVDYTRYFKFDRDPDGTWILLKSSNLSEFYRVYLFADEPKEYIEFIPRWLWHQANLSSRFRNEKRVTQLFNSGRVTLSERTLSLFYKGELEELPIRNEDEFLAKLKYHFGIDWKQITNF